MTNNTGTVLIFFEKTETGNIYVSVKIQSNPSFSVNIKPFKLHRSNDNNKYAHSIEYSFHKHTQREDTHYTLMKTLSF